jgi:hypothetical protein
MNILIQFGQNLKFGRRENKNLVPETQTQIGRGTSVLAAASA